MNVSCKIKKFCEGMAVYEHLLEDEKAINIPFALSFLVTITTINGQLKVFLTDLKNHVCHEIPDIDMDKMDVDKIMSLKFMRDMEALGIISMREYIEEQFGEYLDKTPLEFYNVIRDGVVKMVQQIIEIHQTMESTEPKFFGDFICKRISEGNYDDVKEAYAKKKKKHSEITMEMLQEKQEQVLKQYLDRGLMRFAVRPSKMKMENVDYTFHTALLDYDFEDTREYKKVYTQFMDFATRNEEMLCINYNKYGKYVFVNYDKFSEGQKPALLELCVLLNLIHKDMVELKPELGKYLKVSEDGSLENTEYYGPARSLMTMLNGEWFKQFRASDKFDGKWCEVFSQDFLKSEWKDVIVNEWSHKPRRIGIKAAVIGCLKEAGVIEGSDLSIASAIVEQSDTDANTFARYMGRGRKKPFLEWIIRYVKHPNQ